MMFSKYFDPNFNIVWEEKEYSMNGLLLTSKFDI